MTSEFILVYEIVGTSQGHNKMKNQCHSKQKHAYTQKWAGVPLVIGVTHKRMKKSTRTSVKQYVDPLTTVTFSSVKHKKAYFADCGHKNESRIKAFHRQQWLS